MKLRIQLIGHKIAVAFVPLTLEINTKSYDVNEKTMSHVGFIISNEHKCWSNILWNEELAKIDSMKDF